MHHPILYSWVLRMDDRDELRRLIDVIEKGSGTGSLEQAVDDIKTFANTVSFLANKLDARLKGGEVNAKKRRVGADLSTSAARVAISVGCCATRCFDRFLCEKRRNEVLRNSIYRQAERYASEVYY